jgi:phospholipid transport system transporter-binding protein
MSEPEAGALVPGGSFTPDRRWSVTGALTVDTAGDILIASQDAPLPETGIVSLSGVRAVDSAGVAVLLSWRRRAAAEGKKVSFVDVPASLEALAELYGVEDLLKPADSLQRLA